MRRLFVLLLITIISSCNDDKDVIVTIPTLATSGVSQLTKTSASSGGEIISDGGGTIFDRGLCYSTSPNPTTENFVVPNAAATGSFIGQMTGLTEGTTYYVRAYAINSAGTGYGDEISFTTLASTAPVLTTTAVSSITHTTFISGGSISSDGGLPITASGICYSTSHTPTVSDQVVNGNGQSNFTANASGLIAGTTYYIRAFATNAIGTGYGNEVSFNTLAVTLPILSTRTASLITASSADLGGEITFDGGASITERGICWSTMANPTINDSKISVGSGAGLFETQLVSLSRATTYFARAYAVNSAGVAYGSEVSFETLSIAVGDAFQGGTIFYIDPSGIHGLIVADNDLATTMPWGCPNVDVSTSDAVGSGSQNTANIVASCTTAGIAATECSNLTLNGYDDWFLPAVKELQLIDKNLIAHGRGNFVENHSYWSSSQATELYAYAWDVVHHMSFAPDKSWAILVRPIRAF
jgi:hypothetical protein